jgi:hypothetical protein
MWGENKLGYLGIEKSPSLGEKGRSDCLFERDFRKDKAEDGIW